MTPERQHPEQVQTRLPAAQAAALDIVPGDPGVPPVRHQSAWLLSAGILSLLGVVTAVHLYHAIGTRPTFSLAHQASGDPAVGQQLYRAYGCGSCHTDHPLSTSRGEVGPRLNDFAHSLLIAGQLPNNEANLVRFLQAPQATVPGTAMPNLNVSEPDARNIAAYLYTLGVPPQ